VGWHRLPQLGIVSDDLRLGLREGRSSTELRWPPAKYTHGSRQVAMAGGQMREGKPCGRNAIQGGRSAMVGLS
jgi:hypothetical protein